MSGTRKTEDTGKNPFMKKMKKPSQPPQREEERVERWMSRPELFNTHSTNLLRGGREGEHFVTDDANSDPKRAAQRLALGEVPDIKAKIAVPKGVFGDPSKVAPDGRIDERTGKPKMPGGGNERTASGKIKARVLKEDHAWKKK